MDKPWRSSRDHDNPAGRKRVQGLRKQSLRARGNILAHHRGNRDRRRETTHPEAGSDSLYEDTACLKAKRPHRDAPFSRKRHVIPVREIASSSLFAR
jgi:hypothetical protein